MAQIKIATGIVAASLSCIVSVTTDARPYVLDDRQFGCLVRNVYHEARGEGWLGMLAVAHVTLNRLDHPKFPNTVCEVVKQPYAFSWTLRPEIVNKPLVLKELLPVIEAAETAIEQREADPTFGATYYVEQSIKPDWTTKLKFKRRIGNHVFYGWQ